MKFIFCERYFKSDEVAREEDEYTEVASIKPEVTKVDSVEESPAQVISAESLPKMYPDKSLLEDDRDVLQKLLIQAELDLATLNFR